MLSLSSEVSLVYVLGQSGCHGRLTAGTVERIGPKQIRVYDAYGAPFEYLSGHALRSWCVMDVHGTPLEQWNEMLPADRDGLLAWALSRLEAESIGTQPD
jgi:hypothetical protein